jgi:streptomycin 6-kinase
VFVDTGASQQDSTLPESVEARVDRGVTKQGYLGYVLPCRCQDGALAILKLSPDAREAEEQAIALSAWAGDGAVSLLAKSFEEKGAALLLGRIIPGAALQPLHDPVGERIAQCVQRLSRIPASSVRGSLPSGIERLNALISANARHPITSTPRLRRHQDRIIALANNLARSQWDREGAVLLHGDLHAGNLLVDSNNELVAIDPTPAFGDPEQDIADAAAKNDWGQDLRTRVERLAETCHADRRKVAAYARIAAWNCGIFHTATGTESPGGVDPDELLEYATADRWRL